MDITNGGKKKIKERDYPSLDTTIIKKLDAVKKLGRELNSDVEMAIQEAKEYFGIAVLEIDTRKFIYANSTMRVMFGYDESEFAELTIKNIHPKESHDLIYNYFDKMALGDINYAQNILCIDRKGDKFFVNIISKVVRPNGQKYIVEFFMKVEV